MKTFPACFVLLSSLAPAITLDGIRDEAYGAPVAVQTVQTEFGDNLSELDAAYASIEAGKLHLFLAGNLESNFNKLNIFIDSVAGGQNVIGGTNPPNDGWAGKHNGFTFDAGFAADYLLISRHGFAGGDRFDFDYAVLGTSTSEQFVDIFGGSPTGTSSPLGASGIGVAFNNSNAAGVTGGIDAADQAAASAVATGLELTIPLAAIGNPAGPVRICAMVNGSNHDFLSNQFLGGLAPPQGNLGGDGNAGFTGTVGAINLNNFAGDQFFTVNPAAGPRLAGATLEAGGTQVQFTIDGLTPGQNYQFRDSTTLDSFAAVPGSEFTATASTEVRSLPVNPTAAPARFFDLTPVP